MPEYASVCDRARNVFKPMPNVPLAYVNIYINVWVIFFIRWYVRYDDTQSVTGPYRSQKAMLQMLILHDYTMHGH